MGKTEVAIVMLNPLSGDEDCAFLCGLFLTGRQFAESQTGGEAPFKGYDSLAFLLFRFSFPSNFRNSLKPYAQAEVPQIAIQKMFYG